MECGGTKMKKGGWIQKAVSKNPGSFTKQAQSAGMSVSAFRNKVLANKGDYSSTTVKRANLAKTLSRMRKGEEGMETGKEPNKISSLSPAAQEVVNFANKNTPLETKTSNSDSWYTEEEWDNAVKNNAVLNSTPATSNTKSKLVKGGTEKVAAYQKMLKAKGFNVDVDGAWGPKTQAAYEKYMKSTSTSASSKPSSSWYTTEQWDSAMKANNPSYNPSNNSPRYSLPASKPTFKRKLNPSTTDNTRVSSTLRKGMGGMSVPGVNGSVIGSTVPMSKAGQSFPRRNAGTSKLAKYKKK
jgi:hypothetical protein